MEALPNTTHLSHKALTRTLSGSTATRRASRGWAWASLRRGHKIGQYENDGSCQSGDHDRVSSSPPPSPPSTTTTTTTTTNPLLAAKNACNSINKAKDTEAREEPTKVRIVRALGLSRSNKHKDPSAAPPTAINAGDTERSPYYCTVTMTPIVRGPPSKKKTPPLLRTALEGRLCHYGGLRMDEVEWDQAVDLPIDGPELVVEIKVYARRKYLPDRLVGRTEVSMRAGQRNHRQHKHAPQRFRTLVLEKGDGEPRALLEIVIEPPNSQLRDGLSKRASWPFLCSAVESVQLLAYGGRGEKNRDLSYLGTLPPELVERVCELVEYNMGFDPFRDGEDHQAAQRDRQFLAETMRLRATSATHRWKMMRLRSVPSYALSRRSMTPLASSPGSLCVSYSSLSHPLPRSTSVALHKPPTTLISPALFLSSSCAAQPTTTAPYRYKSLFFWHPQDLEDPVIVRGSRRKGYLTSRALEAGNEHTLTDKHTICYIQSISRADQTFMIREFKEPSHKAFVWNEETLADFVLAVQQRQQTVAVLEQQRRMLIGGVPALGCTFAVSVPARALHTVHKRGLREYELVTVWFAIFDRSCYQFQYSTCTQSPSQTLSLALLAHRKVEDSTFVWILKTLGWRQEVMNARKRLAAATHHTIR